MKTLRFVLTIETDRCDLRNIKFIEQQLEEIICSHMPDPLKGVDEHGCSVELRGIEDS